MFRNPHAFLRAFLGLLLGLATIQPVFAQLDPRLQATKTDFLDLYQKSTTTDLKPEVVTIFDFSGSMQRFMFHPQYVNLDRNDSNTAQNLTFTLQPAVPPGPDIPGINTYTISAASVEESGVRATVDLTVGSNGIVTFSNQWKSGSRTSSNLTTSCSNITVTISGSTVTLDWTLTFQNTASKTTYQPDKDDRWGVAPTTSITANTQSGTISVAPRSTSSVAFRNTWTAPNYNPPTPGTGGVPARVICGLQGTGVSPTSVGLVTPAGTLVTPAIADLSKGDTTSSLAGRDAGAADVRNWVRAASHARFSASVGGVTRTIDLPIPWKLTDSSSTGNPLTSRTVKDQIVKRGVTYGSGLDVELDTNYTLSSGSYVLSSDRAPASTTLSVVDYTRHYIGWLFTAKYSEGSYTGKFIVFDAADASLAGGQGQVSWGQGWGASAKGNKIKIPTYNDATGAYLGEVSQDASNNIVPGMTRVQAVKRAAIETWIRNQASVLWAFRFLDQETEVASSTESNIHNNSATTMNNPAGVPTTETSGTDSGWTLMNNTAAQGNTSVSGNSVTGMKRIAVMTARNSTPLTYAVANALAQFNDPNNIFSAVQTGNDAPSTCMQHFLILFTDGNDNNGSGTLNPNADTPYLVSGRVNALNGNREIIKTPTGINRTGTWWNTFNFAAMAAHLSDTSLGTTPGTDYMAATAIAANTTDVPSKFLPFAIKNRGTVDFGSSGHRITTMTLGVSLGGYYTDSVVNFPVSGKRAMFQTALLGDPTITTGLVTDFHGFDPDTDWIENPANPADYPEVGLRKSGAIYYFDGTNPEKLAVMLQRAIQSTIGASNINSTSNPNLPFIGAALGKQIYLGKFVPPSTGGPIWSGDLMMFATKEENNQTRIIDSGGNVTTTLDASTAQWSAFSALKNNRLWKARKLYTRLPGNASTAESGFTAFSDIDPAFSVIKDEILTKAPDGTTSPSTGPYPSEARVPAATDTAKQAVIQRAMGADLTGPMDSGTPSRPTSNRNNIMGDIVDSSPAVVAYTMTSTFTSSISANSKLVPLSGDRFRLILTGTNQGWLHAFGEVTRDTTVTDSAGKPQTLVKGAVDELWAFMPTDFLGQLDYIFGGSTGNPHRFLVDGAPLLYHLDLPPTGGGAGNGTVDSTERAIAVFGLRKGGRSYYAIDIKDPFNPSLKWSLCPDEAAFFPSTRIVTGGPTLATVKGVLATMGFSTSTPALGRILFNGIVRDVVFFGGGFSTPDVEANFKDKDGTATKLGRSVLALDVYTGEVLAAVDLTTASSGIDCIPAGLVPFELLPNSGMAQRAYFLDYGGGLWSWGSKQTSTGSYENYRVDSSDLAKWTADGATTSSAGIRKVATDGSGNGAKYTTLPAPFRVGNFLGVGKTTGTVVAPTPVAVGVAMISGDRNNPVDTQYTSGTGSNRPEKHRLTVVFDRQDSLAWGLDSTGITDSKLIDFTNQTEPPGTGTTSSKLITPGTSTFYLTNSGSPYFGYYISLPATGSAPDYFIPKGITEPMVVAGSLFYSFFTPTALDVCSGGDGSTYSHLICDVYKPMASDARTGISCISGLQTTWAGVASTFTAYGTRGVLQGGSVPVPNPPLGASKTSLDLKTILGAQQQRYPKARVWRTVY